MGLLDQVLGQVLGQLGGGGQGGGAPMPQGNNPLAPHRPGGLPPMGSGFPQGQPQAQGGGLGGLLGGNLPPIALAILALLASKNLKSGAGGYGSVLHDMLAGRTGAGASPDAAPDRGGAPTGGFLDQIGGMLGGGARPDPTGRVGEPSTGGFGGSTMGGGAGGLGGLLGGLLGGGALSGGLGGLLEQLQQGGLGDKANSWVGPGGNHPIAPDELHQALGDETVSDLSRASGLDQGDLLSQLSQVLPGVVDKLTPHGRLPTADEESRWV